MTSPVGGSGRRGVQAVTGNIAGSKSELDSGAEAFLALSKRLKQVGGTGKGSLRSEMEKAVKKAAKPLPQAVKAEAERRFPKRGGLSKIMGKRTPKVEARTGALTAGVRVRDPKSDPRMSTQGRIYHPLFGKPGSDVVQIVPGVKGYFPDAMEDKAPQVRDDIADVLVDFAQQIARPL